MKKLDFANACNALPIFMDLDKISSKVSSAAESAFSFLKGSIAIPNIFVVYF